MINTDFIKVLYINLTHQSYKIDERKDLYKFLGGVGVGVKLLDENLNSTLDIFHEEQPIVFCIGPLETIYPVVTKVVALFRSPLTEELGESYAGLRLGMAIRFAGYDAIVIKGKSKRPTYLYIHNAGVEFRSAETLWGLGCDEAGRLLRRMENGAGFRSIMRIGRGGENLIHFANVNVDTYRHFGRLGLGALFGSKYLKGIVIHGAGSIPIYHKNKYNRMYQEIYKKVTETDVMEKYHGIGTSINILALSKMNALPTYNLRQSKFEYASEISGEAFMEKKFTRKMACIGCPIGCIHLALHRKKFGDPHEYGCKEISYDHELLFALGSFLGIKNTNEILSLLEVVEEMGLDCITTGVLLGWTTEAFERKLIDKKQLGTTISFGNVNEYITVLKKLVRRENELYKALGRGTYYVAQKYGALDFAAVLGKHEMAGYHTGYGNLIGMSIGARHSHLDNGGYAIDQKMAILNKEKLIDKLIQEEIERNVQNCLIICLFARNIYDFETIVGALKAIGIEKNKKDLMILGKEIFKEKIQLNKKLGFNYTNIKFPRRFFETETPHGLLEENVAKELLELYVNKTEKLLSETTNLFTRSFDSKKLV